MSTRRRHAPWFRAPAPRPSAWEQFRAWLSVSNADILCVLVGVLGVVLDFAVTP